MNLSSVIFLLALLIGSISGYAQNVKSGIGTIAPAQTLHVAGASDKPGTKVGTTTNIYVVKPTVRIEGLNSTNNDAHSSTDGANSLKRVYAAANNGDLILLKSAIEQLTPAVQEFNTISTQPASAAAGILGGETAALITKTFTLNQPSVVNFSASVGATLQTGIADGTAKLYGAYFKFSAVPGSSGVSTTANFGINQKTYTNKTATGVIDNLMLAPRADLVLPAGTYTVNLYGYINGGQTLLFTANFGSTNGENIIITAHPRQF